MTKYYNSISYAVVVTWIAVVVAFCKSSDEHIRSGVTSTSQLIVPEHPRLWIKGSWDWDHNNAGSFAWRILPGQQMPWPWMESSVNDQAEGEFSKSSGADYPDDYEADNIFQEY